MSAEGDFRRWHLEQTAPDQLQRGRTPQPLPLLMRAELPSASLNRHFYATVGADWHWTDRLPWPLERWQAYVSRPELQTWVLYSQGTPAGYVELEQQAGGNVEIAYFGLLPEFHGRGLGGWFLSEALERAWALDAKRVWVHTCSLDHPAALANYQARGMRVFKTETQR